MSPEYAMRGEFSMKSDVYSFGVLILEIISGKKNSNFNESEGAEDLLSYVSTKLVHIVFFFFFFFASLMPSVDREEKA
jgi:serine/threonine protein kinase